MNNSLGISADGYLEGEAPGAGLALISRELLTGRCRWITLTGMRSKVRLIEELEQAAQSMVQGSLSEVTRQCGDPSCACATDPARRHGPHLYLKFTADGKANSVCVPPGQAQLLKDAHRAWVRFQEVATELAADNREQFLRALAREKDKSRARRAKASKKA